MKFEVRLRQGVRYCGYTGGPLNDWLVEQFIQGINNKAIAKKLLVITKVLARVTRKNVELYPKPVTPVDGKVISLELEICHYYMHKLLLVGKV